MHTYFDYVPLLLSRCPVAVIGWRQCRSEKNGLAHCRPTLFKLIRISRINHSVRASEMTYTVSTGGAKHSTHSLYRIRSKCQIPSNGQMDKQPDTSDKWTQQTCVKQIQSFIPPELTVPQQWKDPIVCTISVYLLRELANLALGSCKRRILYETAGNLEPTESGRRHTQQKILITAYLVIGSEARCLRYIKLYIT